MNENKVRFADIQLATVDDSSAAIAGIHVDIANDSNSIESRPFAIWIKQSAD